LGIRWRGVGDTLQFPQRVGATQLMFGLDIGVFAMKRGRGRVTRLVA
jgi:hypothetical protein